MTNPVHLLLTPHRSDSAALLMKHLGQRYVQYINRTYRRSGALWEGRFRSCLMQSEDYLVACYRYIELNTVRAGMVTKPQDYRWSSYHRNGLGNGHPIIDSHDEYRRSDETDEVRRAAYRTLFRDHLDAALVAEIRQSTNGNYVPGGRRFREQIGAALGRRVAPGEVGRPRAKDDKIDGRQRLILFVIIVVCPCFPLISLHTHP